MCHNNEDEKKSEEREREKEKKNNAIPRHIHGYLFCNQLIGLCNIHIENR